MIVRIFRGCAMALLVCLAMPSPVEARKTAPQLQKSIARGQALASARCSGCHGIRPNALSPNAEAPPWDDIANRPGTTAITLRAFLRDSHNYPEAMAFRIQPRQVDDIARYMITLKRKGYKPSL